jgi:hypothetical protein
VIRLGPGAAKSSKPVSSRCERRVRPSMNPRSRLFSGMLRDYRGHNLYSRPSSISRRVAVDSSGLLTMRRVRELPRSTPSSKPLSVLIHARRRPSLPSPRASADAGSRLTCHLCTRGSRAALSRAPPTTRGGPLRAGGRPPINRAEEGPASNLTLRRSWGRFSSNWCRGPPPLPWTCPRRD